MGNKGKKHPSKIRKRRIRRDLRTYSVPQRIKDKKQKDSVTAEIFPSEEMDAEEISETLATATVTASSKNIDDDTDIREDFETFTIDTIQSIITYKKVEHCNVPLCNKSTSDDKVTMHYVPKLKHGLTIVKGKDGLLEVLDQRTAWLRLIKINEKNSSLIKVCSHHFIDTDFVLDPTQKERRLKKNALPSQNLPTRYNIRKESIKEVLDQITPLPTPSQQDKIPSAISGTSLNPSENELSDNTPCLFDELQEDSAGGAGENFEFDMDFETISPAETAIIPLGELCRLCAGRSSGKKLEIFSAEGLAMRIPLMIRQHLPLLIEEEEDGLPLKICECCFAKLQACTQFADKCIQADRTLRQMLEENTQQQCEQMSLMNSKTLAESISDNTEEEVLEVDDSRPIESPLQNEDSRPVESPLQNENTVEVPETPHPVVKQKKKYPKKKNPLTGPGICKFCDKTIASQFLLICHIKSLHKLFYCKICTESFTTQSVLDEHQYDNHFKLCKFCDLKFSNDHFRIHIKTLHSKEMPVFLNLSTIHEPHYCKTCNLRLGTKESLQRHYFWEHGQYVCEICFQVFQSLQEHLQHTDEIHRIPCGYCDEKLYSYRRFIRHVNQKHKSADMNKKLLPVQNTPEQIYKCQFCYKYVSSKEFLKRHHYWSHFKHTCIICLKIFENLDLEEKHLKSVHRHVCLSCEKVLESDTHLQEHITNEHPDFKPFLCEICGDRFEQKQDLVNHRDEKHVSEKKFLCHVCGKSFSVMNSLIQHKHTHDKDKKDKKILCQLCGQKFVFPSQLKTHIEKTHSATKKKKIYSCGTCNSKFYFKRNLRSHIKDLHSNKYLYSCKFCDKYFSDKVIMLDHSLEHKKGKMSKKPYEKLLCFQCEFCSKKFINKLKLKCHLKKIHLKIHKLAKRHVSSKTSLTIKFKKPNNNNRKKH